VTLLGVQVFCCPSFSLFLAAVPQHGRFGRDLFKPSCSRLTLFQVVKASPLGYIGSTAFHLCRPPRAALRGDNASIGSLVGLLLEGCDVVKEACSPVCDTIPGQGPVMRRLALQFTPHSPTVILLLQNTCTRANTGHEDPALLSQRNNRFAVFFTLLKRVRRLCLRSGF